MTSETCKIIRGDQLEVEVNSGAMTRLAGVSESLTGSTGIHLAVATVPPRAVLNYPLPYKL